MTSRERVLTALAHQSTDRVPRLLYEEANGYTPAIDTLLRTHCSPQTPLKYFDMDITRVVVNPTALPRSRFSEWLGSSHKEAIDSGKVDEWGVWWQAGNYYHFSKIFSPLKGIQDFKRIQEYPWPDLNQSYRYDSVKQKVDQLHKQGLAVVASAGSVFERSWYIRGMEDLMMDMLESPEIACYLFERTAQLQQQVAAQFARASVDIIITGDDVAGQKQLLMNINTWRKYLKPHLAATVQSVKAANPDTYVFYHSDGNVEPIIPDLIRTGIDILNPIQPECMNPAAIKREYGKQLSFWGSVSVQRTMPYGTPDQVRVEVRTRIKEMGYDGGFILAPAHVLGPDVPWENIVAFFEAANGDAAQSL